ncbi:hypothetical protein Poly24_08030 [Rosistilla carotiformis]|uniref:Uncharacterized protein n=1 Tax=Rosistilla carotiformis TaxID=2528017 RepID=A0A518JNI3_9BACT|nr:hypothetical protein Poly24_08030 [Rosistilla carotiformis]
MTTGNMIALNSSPTGVVRFQSSVGDMPVPWADGERCLGIQDRKLQRPRLPVHSFVLNRIHQQRRCKQRGPQPSQVNRLSPAQRPRHAPRCPLRLSTGGATAKKRTGNLWSDWHRIKKLGFLSGSKAFQIPSLIEIVCRERPACVKCRDFKRTIQVSASVGFGSRLCFGISTEFAACLAQTRKPRHLD